MNKEIIVKKYKGKQNSATNSFKRDSAKMSSNGYLPTSQNWSQGSWGCGAFIVALLLCIVIIGIIAFIYMLVVKPDGTLTVTYRLKEGHNQFNKTCPMCAEEIKYEAKICKHCGHKQEVILTVE